MEGYSYGSSYETGGFACLPTKHKHNRPRGLQVAIAIVIERRTVRESPASFGLDRPFAFEFKSV